MKVGLTFGVFDYFHYGHLKLFERCKSYCDYLIVAVQKSEEINKTKPDAKILYTTKQRIEMVSAIKFVDKAIEYTSVEDDIAKIDFDIFILGGDQNHCGFVNAINWCKENNKDIIRLERTEGICSSNLKRSLI